MACFFLHLRLGSHPSNCDVEIPYDTDTSTFLQTTTVQDRRKVQMFVASSNKVLFEMNVTN